MAIICKEQRLLFVMVPANGSTALGAVLLKQFGGQWLPEDDIFQDGKMILESKHNSIPQILEHGLLSQTELDKYIKFTTVRNPFDRLVTFYQRLVGGWMERALENENPDSWLQRGPEQFREALRHQQLANIERARELGFDEWVLRRLGLSKPKGAIKKSKAMLKKFLPGERRRKFESFYPLIEGVDQILRYESLEEDFNAVLRKAGIRDFVPLRRSGRTGAGTPGKKPYHEYYTSELSMLIENAYSTELAAFDYSFPREPNVGVAETTYHAIRTS